MRKIFLLSFITIFFLLFLPIKIVALDNGLALTPPMGFNTWNWFGCNNAQRGVISEKLIIEIANAMVKSGMKDAGYEYVNIDDCWAESSRDERGGIVPNRTNFPHGMKWLADSIHRMGLKLGIYTDVAELTCAKTMPGMKDHENQDADTFVAWGIDYIKVDWCGGTGSAPAAYRKVRDALRSAVTRMKPKVPTAHEIVFSICNWGQQNPWLWGDTIGNLWRTTGDIQLSWSSITSIIDQNVNLYPYAKPGAWNDPDMLEVGNGLPAYEDSSHFAIWCMLSAPLIAGNDIRNMNNTTRGILTNKGAIAIDQDSLGWQGRRVKNQNGVELWYKRLLTRDATGQLVRDSTKIKKAILIFNRSNNNVSTYDIMRSDNCEFGNTEFTVYNAWNNNLIGTFSSSLSSFKYTNTIRSHGHALLLFIPTQLVSVKEDISKKAEDKIISSIRWMNTNNGIDVLLPINGFIMIFDIQGKRIVSFNAIAGRWNSISSAKMIKGSTYVIKVKVGNLTCVRPFTLVY